MANFDVSSKFGNDARAAMEALGDISLFSRVGLPADGDDAAFVKNWDQAVKSLISYQSIELYRMLRYSRSEIGSLRGEGALNWKSAYADICPHISELVRRKFRSKETRAALVGVYKDDIFPDIVNDFVLIVLGRVFDMGAGFSLIEAKLKWYRAGRFPCGWRGQLAETVEQSIPRGKLLLL